jgi:hypothetical protein
MGGWKKFIHNPVRVGAALMTSGLSEGVRALIPKRGGDPNEAANKYLDQIPGQLKEYADPYIQQGKDAYGQLSPEYNKMTSDPTAFLENMMKGYEPSKAYQMQRDEALQAAGNSAAAGGMRGTTMDRDDSSRIASMLQGQDMQQWLQNVMGIKGAGMQGQQGFYDKGFMASSQLGSDLSNVLGTKATNAFQGVQQQNQARNDMISKLMGLVGGGIGAGAGALAGGPAGAMMGSQAGQGLASTFGPGQGMNYQPFSQNSPLGQGSWRGR